MFCEAAEFLAAEREVLMDVLMPGVQAFAPNVWIIDGPTVRDFGILFPTRMTVVKLANGTSGGSPCGTRSFQTHSSGPS